MEPSLRILGFGTDTVDAEITEMSYDKPEWFNVGQPLSSDEIQTKVSKWNQHRENISNDVLNAMTNRELRNRRVVIFERILALYETGSKNENAQRFAGASIFNVVKPVLRNDEHRGQSWAIIAIIGDPEREESRTLAISKLADTYFDFMRKSVDLENGIDSDDSVVSSYFLKDDQDVLDNQFIGENTSDFFSILMMRNEPMVSFFGFSDDPDALVVKSSKLAEHADLKHADIAVVSMYSWLFLESWKKSKGIKRTSRDSKADAFFKTMREALV
jgi:hypothetical protein